MGLDLTYSADGTTFSRRFSAAEWATIEVLRAYVAEEIQTCFDISDLGSSVQIEACLLKSAAAAIDEFLSGNAHLLPATYQFKIEGSPTQWLNDDAFDTGGVSGLRLPNDPNHRYAIKAGLNELVLKKRAIGPDGAYEVEVRDIRDESELQLEDGGRVKFRRRAAKTTLRRTIREIAAFASAVRSDEVTKTIG